MMNLADLVFIQARRRNPSALAICCNEEQITYEALEHATRDAVATLLAAGLPQRGANRVPRIGLACPNSSDHIILALAILQAGGCLVPIAQELAPPEREAILQTVGLDAVIVSDKMPWPERASGPGRAVPLPSLRATLYLDLGTASPVDEACFAALNPAFIRFSSGTTGKAKGVILSHETLLARTETANRHLGITENDRIVWILSMAHHFAVSIMLYLLKGATTIIVENHLAEEILSAAIAHHGTLLYGAPFHHALLAAEPSRRPWPTLRLAVSTAAPLSADIAHAFHARYGVPLSQALGIIEVGLPLLNRSPLTKPTAIGRATPHVEVQLRDPDTGAPVPVATPGELFLRCPGMLDAYLSPWQPRPAFLTPDGWFCTGDLAVTDGDGDLHLVGRTKTVINIGGSKCFPEEIETVLQTHPEVAAVRVSGRPHPRFGNVPVAEIVPRNPAEPPAVASLVALCRKSLASYKIPIDFRFVEAIPRTASGKIRR